MNELHNFDAERSVIGSIMLSNEKIYVCKELNLDYTDFYFQKNRIIYKYMQKFCAEERPLDLLSISDEIERHENFDSIPCMVYILHAINITPVSDHVDQYAKIVKHYSLRRNLKSALMKKVSSIATVSLDDMMTFCDTLKDEMMNTGELDKLFLNAADISFSTEEIPTIKTGFAQLDGACGGGLAQGSLTILTGSPGSGKSSFVNQIIAQAISNDTKCFLYSGELTYQMQIHWFAKTVANADDLVVSSSFFGKSYNITIDCWNAIATWMSDSLFIYSKDVAADEKNLSNTIEFLAVKKGVKLFVLDNLMTLEFMGSDKYEKQIAAVKSIKALAKKYNLAIILIAHPNKSTLTSRESHVFEISGASEVPNMADYVIKIVRNEDDSTEIIVMKNRITGIQGKKFSFSFSPMRKRFYSENKEEILRDFGYRQAQTKKEKEEKDEQGQKASSTPAQ